eukprot:gene30169-36446_t
MEELVALSIEFSSIKLEHRRSAVGLAKVGVGCFDDVYSKVPSSDGQFGVLSLFSILAPFNLQEAFADGLQVELYSEKSSLELICAGRLETLDFVHTVIEKEKIRHPANRKSVLKPLCDSTKIMVPLYFKAGDTFSIAAGSINMEIRVFTVLEENALKSTTCASCLLDDPLSSEVVLEMPAAIQTSVDLTDRSCELSDESEEDAEDLQCDSDASLDGFVQNFLGKTNQVSVAPVAVRESVQSMESVQTQLTALKQKVRAEGKGREEDDASRIKFRRPKKPKVPHYMMPARTPSFQDMLRKR